MSQETIKKVPQYLGYHASIEGYIYFGFGNKLEEIEPRKNPHSGYLEIKPRVASFGDRKQVSVHQMVLSAFRGEPKIGQVARHLNGDSTDNRLCNLEWGTQKENYKDSVNHGTAIVGMRGNKNRTAKLKESDIPDIRELLNKGLAYKQIGQIYGVNYNCIGAIARGRCWNHC